LHRYFGLNAKTKMLHIRMRIWRFCGTEAKVYAIMFQGQTIKKPMLGKIGLLNNSLGIGRLHMPLLGKCQTTYEALMKLPP